MSEREQLPAFDDELLSAYLDGELAPEERARVEERLAADPAARQLLAELRGVSQAMKGLPVESLGADLRETVLRRAERAMLVSGESSAEDENASSWKATLARIPIGRTRRSWFWVGMTVAAGIFVMIFDRGPENAGLPRQVAERAPASAPGIPPLDHPLGELELHAAPESSITRLVAEPAAAPPAAPMPPLGVSANGELSGRAAVAGRENDRFFAAEPNSSEVAKESVALDAVEAGPAVASDVEAGDADLLVVHMNVRPEALRGKLFDAVLLKNGIAFEESSDKLASAEMRRGAPASGGASISGKDSSEAPAPASAAPANAPKELRESVVADAQTGKPLQDREGQQDGEQDVDVVLVDAPTQQIFSCLTEIKADHQNYLGIAVDEEPTTSEALAKKIAKYKNQSTDWSQFNRGMELVQQKAQLAPDNNYYYQTERGQVVVNRARGVEPDVKFESRVSALGDEQSKIANQSRAIRMAPQQQLAGGLGGEKPTDDRAQVRRAMSAARASDEMKPRLEPSDAFRSGGANAADDHVQVLFVLRAGEDAAQLKESGDRIQGTGKNAE